MPGGEVEIVHVGSASRDLTPDDSRGWRLGGGATYAALATARLGLRTAAVIGVDAQAATARELDLLRDAGVDLMLLRLAEGPVFENRETPDGRHQICDTPGVPLEVPALPERWLRARAWSLVPVADEVSEAWTSSVGREAYLVVGWQGMLRELSAGQAVTRRPPRASALLKRADLVGVSHHDVEAGTTLATLGDLLHPGANMLVTQGRAGGLLVEVGDAGPAHVWHYRSSTSDREDDPTGAGDTFLAALAASVLRPAIVGRGRARRTPDLRFAAAAGSLVVEGPGLEAVPDRAAVLVRRARERVRRAVVPSEASQVSVLAAPSHESLVDPVEGDAPRAPDTAPGPGSARRRRR